VFALLCFAADAKGGEEGSRKGWMQSSITNVKNMMSRVAESVSQVALVFPSYSYFPLHLDLKTRQKDHGIGSIFVQALTAYKHRAVTKENFLNS
jgi:hypothetical protein